MAKSLITVDLRSQSCLKVRPERRKKELKRKLNRANSDKLLSFFSHIFRDAFTSKQMIFW
jgi:hypothetical protein